jgi:hypothetical protein
MVRQGCFGTGHPVFPPFYGFLSHAPKYFVKCLGDPIPAEYPQVNADLRYFPDYSLTLLNCLSEVTSEQTNGTFTVFVKLTMCSATL